MGCAGSKPVATSTVAPENTDTKNNNKDTSSSTTASTTASVTTSSSDDKHLKSKPSKFNLLHKLPSFVSVKSLETRYTLGKVLGRGGFGEVREAIRKSDGKR